MSQSVRNESKLPQNVREQLMEIGVKEQLTNCSVVENIEDAADECECGMVIRVSLHGIRHGIKCELKLICKLMSPGRLGDMGLDAFVREAYVYNTVLEDFQKFQKRRGLSASNEFRQFPKCYAAVADSVTRRYFIILEDWRPFGYCKVDKLVTMEFDYVKEVMQSLGRLHAVSFAMKDKEPELFDKFKNLNDRLVLQMRDDDDFQKAFKHSFNKCYAAFESVDVKEIQAITYFKENILDVLSTMTNSGVDDKFNVVIHGDMWLNNILFANVGDQLNSRLVGWQMARYSSPAADISFFMFTSTDKKFRDMHYVDALKLYHKSLTEALAAFGCDPQRIFTYDDLLNQMKKFGKLGIVYAPLLQMIAGRRGDESTTSSVDVPTNVKSLSNKYSIDSCNERIREVVRDGIKYGYI